MTVKALLGLVDSSAFIKTWANFEGKKKRNLQNIPETKSIGIQISMKCLMLRSTTNR